MKLLPFFAMLFFLAGCTFAEARKNAAASNSGARQIELYAQQFKWTVRYAGVDNVLGGSSYKWVTATNPLGLDTNDVYGYDDVIVTDTFFLPLFEAAELTIHSRDVIHAAYFPHFRAQMNAVPGMSTHLQLKPEKTTLEMRRMTNDSLFDYALLCNKICGAEHYKMKMKVVVSTRHTFDDWMSRHPAFFAGRKLPVTIPPQEGEGK